MRQRKDDGDGLQLCDHQQTVAIGGVDDVSDIHQAQPDAPTNRRGYVGIDDLQLGVINRALISLDRALKHADLRTLCIELLLGDDALFVEKLETLIVHLHVAKLRLIFGELTLSLLELNLERTGIDVD